MIETCRSLKVYRYNIPIITLLYKRNLSITTGIINFEGIRWEYWMDNIPCHIEL